jgi:hypothetical protein
MASSQLFAITPYVTSLPLDKTAAVSISHGSAVEVFVEVVGGAGKLYLIKWVEEASKWFPLQNPLPLDSTVNSGRDHARWVIDRDCPNYYQLLFVPTGGATISAAYLHTIRV